MNIPESKYVENKAYLARCAREQTLAFRESAGRLATEFGSEEEWLRCVQDTFPKFIPFLTKNCGLEFRGRVLEIGAGGAWLSAELSKLPGVVEVFATDASPLRLQELAPKVFKAVNANNAK